MVQKNLELLRWNLLQNFPLCNGNRLPVKTLNYYVENYSKMFFVFHQKKSTLDFFLDLNLNESFW